jgi:hypothetical protein
MPDDAHAPARAVRWLGLATVLLVALSGCDSAAAGGLSANRELINDVASRLTGAESVTYTASYLLGTGASGSIAHIPAPARTAYAYPGGKIVATAAGLTACSTKPPCQLRPAVNTTAPDPTLDDTLAAGGLVRPSVVVTMLTTAALDANVIVAEHEATYGGSTATCVTLTGDNNTRSFSACVTSGGLLGSFEGDVGGRHVTMTLDRFALTAPETAFEVPVDGQTVNTSG